MSDRIALYRSCLTILPTMFTANIGFFRGFAFSVDVKGRRRRNFRFRKKALCLVSVNAEDPHRIYQCA